jgi:hypothetical protein
MSKFIYTQILDYEVEALRRQTNRIQEAYDVLHEHVMSLPLDVPIEEFGKLSEALASIYTAKLLINIDVECIEKRQKHEL